MNARSGSQPNVLNLYQNRLFREAKRSLQVHFFSSPQLPSVVPRVVQNRRFISASSGKSGAKWYYAHHLQR